MEQLTAGGLRGVWATVLLPIRPDESIDTERLAVALDRVLASGVHGVYTDGTAGEFHTLTEAEYDRLHELVALRCTAADVPFQLGAGHPSGQLSLDRIARAADLRPGAIQVVLPDWLPLTPDEVLAAVERTAVVADGVPLVLYNPPYAKTQVEPELFGRLADEVPALIGMRVPGGDKSWYARMADAVGGRLAVFVAGHTLASGYALGAAGAYSNVACLSPGGAARWYAQMTRRRWAATSCSAPAARTSAPTPLGPTPPGSTPTRPATNAGPAAAARPWRHRAAAATAGRAGEADRGSALFGGSRRHRTPDGPAARGPGHRHRGGWADRGARRRRGPRGARRRRRAHRGRHARFNAAAGLIGTTMLSLQDDVVRYEVTRTGHRHHNPIEPASTLAWWSGAELTVQDSAQGISAVREVMAATFAVPADHVHVSSPFVGGGFGCKGYVHPHQLLAVAAARVLGRPVRVTLTRAQMFIGCGHQPATRQELTLGATRDGRLTAVGHHSVSASALADDYVEYTTAGTRWMYATPVAAARSATSSV